MKGEEEGDGTKLTSMVIIGTCKLYIYIHTMILWGGWGSFKKKKKFYSMFDI